MKKKKLPDLPPDACEIFLLVLNSCALLVAGDTDYMTSYSSIPSIARRKRKTRGA